jgi:hypothetical protein
MRRHPARLAAFVIRCYPRRWRERYADEVLALVEDVGIGWLGVFDLARGALRERAIDLDVLLFAWCHPSEAPINRRIVGRYLVLVGVTLVSPPLVVGAAHLLTGANVAVAVGVATTFSYLLVLAYVRMIGCYAASFIEALRWIWSGRRPNGLSTTRWTSVSSTEVVVWSSILLVHLTIQTVDDVQRVNWRRLYTMCWMFLLPWKFLLSSLRLDMNRLGEITLERTRQQVRLIGLGLDEPKASERRCGRASSK